MLAPILLTALLAAPVPKFTENDRHQKLAGAFDEADRIFARFHAERPAPGLIYGIVIDGQLAHIKSYGVRSLAPNEPVTPDTVFRIASMTKSFTALAVLKLRDQGKLSLDDPVEKWIPEFAHMQKPTEDAGPIRIRHLLTHSAGFPEDNPWGDQQLGVSEQTLTEWLRKGIPFSTAPGSAYEYSNYGFALAGRVVQKASGMPYRDYLDKHILAPLGMKASTLEPSAVPHKVRAQGYRRLADGKYVEEPSLPHGSFGAMGGLLTSANDLARYVAFMLSAFPPRDGEEVGPVRRSSVREMQQMWRQSDLSATGATSNAPLAISAAGYGYGLRVSRDCRFAHIVGHGGGLPGFGSYMMWLPEYGVGIFALANVTYAGPAGAITEAFDALRKTGALKPRVLPPSTVLTSARDAIFGLWKEWDVSAAAKIAANNLFLDTPEALRRSEIDRLKAKVGVCGDSTPVEPENWLRGNFRLNCERGTVRVTFTMAPTQPPTIQYLRFEENPPPSDNLCSP
jgi:CubicO group peptidase (beta-lactamase class C family)